LTETFFIILYLDERFPDPPLGGGDPQARYTVQKWGKYVETHIAPNLAVVGWSMHGRKPNAAARDGFERLTAERRLLWRHACVGFNDAELAAARAAVEKAIARVEDDLADRPWLAGAAYGVADIAVFPHIVRARALGLAVPSLVADWLDRVAARPAVTEALGTSETRRDFATMGPERGRWG
jgi:glutathione S-transferase